MRTLFKVSLFFCLVISFCYKGQLSDTLAYLKSFETTKEKYIGQPFSKLLNDMKIIHPQRLNTQKGGSNYVTQFWFVSENPYNSPYKMDIVWENSYLFKGEEIKQGFYNMAEVESEYKNYKIKGLEIPDGGLYLGTHDAISEELDPYTLIDSHLKENKSLLLNNSFFEFLCMIRACRMKIHKIKNLHTNSKKEIVLTIFSIKNPFNRKKAKIIVTWKTPLTDYQIREYKSKNGKCFNDTKRNFYIDKIIKDIILLKK